MSFGSILKNIAHGVSVGLGAATAIANPLEPFLALIPGVGTVAATVIGAMDAVEGLITPANSGAAKKAIAVNIVNAVHPGLDQGELGSAIDGLVGAVKLVEAALNKIPVAKT
jgi:hypothetical protein